MSRGSWGQMRLIGLKRCVMPVVNTSGGRESRGPGTPRFTLRVKGNQCRNFVTPERIQANGGVPVCQLHIEAYRGVVSARAGEIAKRRARLDPGCAVE